MSTATKPACISFDYRPPKADVTRCALIRWKESGHYLVGVDAQIFKPRTYRKDRVVTYFDGADAHLDEPFPEPPPIVERRPSTNPDAAHILFTGFAAVQRADLEAKATAHGLVVCKSVTKGCLFVVGGYNAGPKKIEAAREARKYILDQAQFLQMLATGEVPDQYVDEKVTDC